MSHPFSTHEPLDTFFSVLNVFSYIDNTLYKNKRPQKVVSIHTLRTLKSLPLKVPFTFLLLFFYTQQILQGLLLFTEFIV